MNPKKAKDTAVDTAKELGLSSSMVEDIISFYWKEIRKTLTQAKNNSLIITKVGCFKVRYTTINNTLENYKRILSSKNPLTSETSFQRTKGYKLLEEKIAIINNLLEIREQEKKNMIEFKIKKNAESNKNLEK